MFACERVQQRRAAHLAAVVFAVAAVLSCPATADNPPQSFVDRVVRMVPDVNYCVTVNTNVRDVKHPLDNSVGCGTSNVLEDAALIVAKENTTAGTSRRESNGAEYIRAPALESLDGSPTEAPPPCPVKLTSPFRHDGPDGLPMISHGRVVVPTADYINSFASTGAFLKALRLCHKQFAIIGVIIPATTMRPDRPSANPGQVSPNAHSSVYGKPHPWNPAGDESAWSHFPFQVLQVGEASYRDALRRAQYHRDVPQSAPAAQMAYAMWSKGMNSTECFAQGKCLPIGGLSTWGAALPLPPGMSYTKGSNATETRETIVVVVPSTSTGALHGNVPAVNSAVTGSVALLLLADALSLYLEAGSSSPRFDLLTMQVVFLFAHADEYGFAGSARFFDEVSQFTCYEPRRNISEQHKRVCQYPAYAQTNFTSLNISHVRHVIHLEQLGIGSDLYVHTDENRNRNATYQAKVNAAFRHAGVKRYKNASSTQLPPSSTFPFVNTYGVAKNVSATVLSAYDTSYNGDVFQSEHDVLDRRINNETVYSAAGLIADVILDMAFNKSHAGPAPTQPVINKTLGAELLRCLGYNLGCPLVAGLIGTAEVPDAAPVTPNYYPGVWSWDSYTTQQQTFYKAFLVSRFPSANSPARPAESKKFPCNASCASVQYTCVGGQCMEGRAFHHYALSLRVNYTKGSISLANESRANYFLATESNWGETLFTRLYMYQWPGLDVLCFVAGTVSTVLLMLLTTGLALWHSRA